MFNEQECRNTFSHVTASPEAYRRVLRMAKRKHRAPLRRRTAILIAALVFEIIMAAATFIKAFSKEILHPDGLDVVNVFGTKTYLWKNLQRFEILWDYEGKRMVKKEQTDAPYILLKFENPKKKIRFDYREDIDQCIRVNYGLPHVDNWTNIGK